MAREVEVDESPDAVDRAFRKVIKRHKPLASGTVRKADR
jgi:hypothetical protein